MSLLHSRSLEKVEVPSPGPVPADADLLRRFLRQRDEEAFEELVSRFGPLVYAVALRVVHDRHAAEDVFQATFFVLARDASKVRRKASIASWLHGVALRLAKKALARRHRQAGAGDVEELELMTATPLEEVESAFDQQVLDEELHGLPAHYREVLVLHFLEGKTYEETARALGVSVGVVEGRLKRGKRELKLRLARRGVGLSVAIGAIAWSQSAAQAGIGEGLITAAVEGGLAVSHGTPFTSNCSSEAVHLAAKETVMLTTGKVTLTACCVMAALIGGGVIIAHQPGTADASGLPQIPSSEIPFPAQGGEESVEAVLALQDTDAGELAPTQGVGPRGGLLGDFRSDGTVDAALTGAEYEELQERADDLSKTAATEITVSTNLRPREEEILETLDQITSVEFPGNPLSDVIDFISTQHNIPILLDINTLADEGIGPDEEITLILSNVTLRSAMKLMLENVGGIELTFVVEDEVLKITTALAAQEKLETRVYDVRPLFQAVEAQRRDVSEYDGAMFDGAMEGAGLGGGMSYDGPGEIRVGFGRKAGSPRMLDDPQTLVDVLVHTTSGPWLTKDDQGGEISYFRGSFVVRQTQAVHEEIESLLNNLLRQVQASEQSPAWPAPDRPKPAPPQKEESTSMQRTRPVPAEPPAALATPKDLVLGVGFPMQDGEPLDTEPNVFYGNQAIRIEDFGPQLEAEFEDRSQQFGEAAAREAIVVIRSSPDVPAGAVQDLIQRAQDAGFNRVALRALQPTDDDDS
jgi:RNA polymerase sigma factor (sigma-70 family)